MELAWVERMYLKLRNLNMSVEEAADLADVCARAVGQKTFNELEEPFQHTLADLWALPEVAA